MNSKLTVIIPTYERHDSLRVVLEYWASFPVHLMVLDGSKRPIEFKNELANNVSYFYLPISLEDRLLFAQSKIQTTYAILSCDDEIFIYSTLERGMNILDNDTAISAILGQTLGFSNYQNKLSIFPEYSTAKLLSITGDTPCKRLKERVAVPGNSIYYSLTRTETMVSALKFIGEKYYSCSYVSEYIMETVLCASGSVLYIPNLMWFRNRCGDIVENKEWDRSKLLVDWCKDYNNRPEMSKLEKSFERHLSSISIGGALTGGQIIQLFCDYELNCQNHKVLLDSEDFSIFCSEAEFKNAINFLNILALREHSPSAA